MAGTPRFVASITLLVLAATVSGGRADLSDVRINEFMASNSSVLADEDGDFSDWLELYNAGATTVDLDGAYLTDNANRPTKWRIPAVALDAGGFLVIFASSKDRASVGAELHTNFALSAGGEYLALVAPDGTTRISEFAPTFPAQVPDVAYGVGPGTLTGYLPTATPGAANPTTLFEFVFPVEFSAPHGFYDAPVDLALSTATVGADIRYTTDGTLPTETEGTVYTEPIRVSRTTTLRVAAFQPGKQPTAPVSHTLIFLDDVLTQTGSAFPAKWGSRPADYAMDPRIVDDAVYGTEIRADMKAIPTLSIVTTVADMFGPNGVYSNPHARGDDFVRLANVELILPDGSSGFTTSAGVRIQGNASRKRTNPKHSLRLNFNSDFGPSTLKFPIFPGTTVAEQRSISLRAGWQDGWLRQLRRVRHPLYVRDQFASDTQLALGEVAAHGMSVHVYLNGLYWGVYGASERPNDWFAAAYFGGQPDDWDVIKDGALDDGSEAAWREMHRLADKRVGTPQGYALLQQYLDVDSLIDYLIVNHYVGNRDWIGQNWIAARRRAPGEGFKFISWDAEVSLGNPHFNNLSMGLSRTPTGLYKVLRQFSAEFQLRFADRVHRAYFNGGALTPEATTARFTARADEISGAIVAESARWGDALSPKRPHARDPEWTRERDRLLATFFPLRSQVMLAQYRKKGLYPTVVAPSFNQHGGVVPPGFVLTMSAPDTVYYTTDGSDPRLAGGAIAPTAFTYAAGISLAQSGQIKARTLARGSWSALNEAAFTVQTPTGGLPEG